MADKRTIQANQVADAFNNLIQTKAAANAPEKDVAGNTQDVWIGWDPVVTSSECAISSVRVSDEEFSAAPILEAYNTLRTRQS